MSATIPSEIGHSGAASPPALMSYAAGSREVPLLRETIGEIGATSKAQMGSVMKALQAKVAGRVDGKTLSAEVQKQLS